MKPWIPDMLHDVVSAYNRSTTWNCTFRNAFQTTECLRTNGYDH